MISSYAFVGRHSCCTPYCMLQGLCPASHTENAYLWKHAHLLGQRSYKLTQRFLHISKQLPRVLHDIQRHVCCPRPRKEQGGHVDTVGHHDESLSIPRSSQGSLLSSQRIAALIQAKVLGGSSRFKRSITQLHVWSCQWACAQTSFRK